MRRILPFALLFLSAACGRMPRVHYYDFSLEAPARAAGPAAGVLCVQPFTSLPAGDQDRMVYRDSAWEIQFDAYRRWIAPPPDLLRERLVEYLRGSSRYAAVVTTPPRQEPFSVLAVQLLRFDETIAAEGRQAVTRLWFELSDERGALLRSGYIEGSAEITGADAGGLVEGMRASASWAFAQLLEKL